MENTLKALLAFLLLFSAHFLSAATGDGKNILLPKDTIFLNVGDFQEKIFEHKIERQQTIWTLAKFYGLSMSEMKYYNPDLISKPSATPGQIIKIPIPNRSIVRQRDKNFHAKDYVPVFYTVKKGETLYKIAKGYFNMEEDSLLKRNNIGEKALKNGQQLLVGWLSITGIPQQSRQAKDPIVRIVSNFKAQFVNESFGRKEVQERGVALWQKDSKDQTDLYVLHNGCAANGIIAINNPMKNRTVYAKVLDRIPDGAYPKNVQVVISPMVAKLLGALDPNFFVKLKYYK